MPNLKIFQPQIPESVEEIITLIEKSPKKLLENCKSETYKNTVLGLINSCQQMGILQEIGQKLNFSLNNIELTEIRRQIFDSIKTRQDRIQVNISSSADQREKDLTAQQEEIFETELNILRKYVAAQEAKSRETALKDHTILAQQIAVIKNREYQILLQKVKQKLYPKIWDQWQKINLEPQNYTEILDTATNRMKILTGSVEFDQFGINYDSNYKENFVEIDGQKLFINLVKDCFELSMSDTVNLFLSEIYLFLLELQKTPNIAFDSPKIEKIITHITTANFIALDDKNPENILKFDKSAIMKLYALLEFSDQIQKSCQEKLLEDCSIKLHMQSGEQTMISK